MSAVVVILVMMVVVEVVVVLQQRHRQALLGTRSRLIEKISIVFTLR